ncbi:hypothetical protein F5Y14DRAFT_419429 [Nemania sp. NC0429]|nr:hypothetical protein F5Y14DRAFT_419429 [Nemania sp. NC0429]
MHAKISLVSIFLSSGMGAAIPTLPLNLTWVFLLHLITGAYGICERCNHFVYFVMKAVHCIYHVYPSLLGNRSPLRHGTRIGPTM